MSCRRTLVPRWDSNHGLYEPQARDISPRPRHHITISFSGTVNLASEGPPCFVRMDWKFILCSLAKGVLLLVAQGMLAQNNRPLRLQETKL